MAQFTVDPQALADLADDLSAIGAGLDDRAPHRRLSAELCGSEVVSERLHTFVTRAEAALHDLRGDLRVVVPALHAAASAYAVTESGVAAMATPR